MDQDKALAKLNLAGIALSKRRKKTQILLTDVKRLDSKGRTCRANQVHQAANEKI